MYTPICLLFFSHYTWWTWRSCRDGICCHHLPRNAGPQLLICKCQWKPEPYLALLSHGFATTCWIKSQFTVSSWKKQRNGQCKDIFLGTTGRQITKPTYLPPLFRLMVSIANVERGVLKGALMDTSETTAPSLKCRFVFIGRSEVQVWKEHSVLEAMTQKEGWARSNKLAGQREKIEDEVIVDARTVSVWENDSGMRVRSCRWNKERSVLVHFWLPTRWKMLMARV